MKKILVAAVLAFTPMAALAQQEGFKTRDQVMHETAYWTGERFADGRPKVAGPSRHPAHRRGRWTRRRPHPGDQ